MSGKARAMPRKQSTAARRARALTRAGAHRYTDALRRSGTPPVAVRKNVWDQGAADGALARALRRAGLVEDADNLQSVVDYEAPDDPSANGWAYQYEEDVLSAVAIALAAVATRPGVRFLTGAVAEVIDNRNLGFTADTVRSMTVRDVDGHRATPAAWQARRALWALRAASEVPRGRDHEWHACMDLLYRAGEYAAQASCLPDRHRRRARVEAAPPSQWRALLRERHPDQPELHHPPLDTQVTRCTGCGELRATTPGQDHDPWHGHTETPAKAH